MGRETSAASLKLRNKTWVILAESSPEALSNKNIPWS